MAAVEEHAGDAGQPVCVRQDLALLEPGAVEKYGQMRTNAVAASGPAL